MNLLNKATEVPNVEYSEGELLELALAWIKTEISHQQAAKALQRANSPTVYTLANALRRAYADGKIIIKQK